MSNEQLEAIAAQVVEKLDGKFTRVDFCNERSDNLSKRIGLSNKVTLTVLGMQVPIIGLLIAIVGKLY